MVKHRVAYLTSGGEADTSLFERGLSGLDYEIDVHVCKSNGETIEAVKDADVVVNQGVPMPKEVIREFEGQQAIVSFGHGFNHIDHNAATERNIMVVNTAGFCTEEVSNHAITLLLSCAKKITILNDLVKQGKWGADTRAQLVPMPNIDGQTLGLVAFGNIARATGRKAKVFGLEVIAYDPFVPPWIAKEYKVELVSSLEELAQRSDFVSDHVPLNDDTRGLLGAPFFKAMKPTAYFINTCRGPTVDEKSLIAALENGEIAGAGLDVFEEEPTPADNPLLKMDNVIATPHSAGSSSNSRVAAPTQLGQETARILSGSWPMSLVNPEVRADIAVRQTALNRQ